MFEIPYLMDLTGYWHWIVSTNSCAMHVLNMLNTTMTLKKRVRRMVLT